MFRKFEIRSSRYAEFLATTVLGRSLSYVLLTVLLVACEEPPNPGITATPVTPVTPIDSNSFEPTNVVVTPADGEVILQWVNPQDPDTTIGSVNIVVQVYANNTNDLSANPPIDQANVLEDYAGDGIPQSYSYPSTNESLYYSFRMAFVASNGETYEPKANADIIERRDSLDIDLDDDGVLNRLDLCARGESGWQSTNITDYDGDGCRDASSEDNDDDNDQVSDDLDSCTRGIMGWQSTSITDYDGDGCQDASPEDEDDDNDRVSDLFDSCARGIIGWESNSTTDYDDDGCRDASPEDEDDDNDRVSDLFDSCARGIIGWESNGTTDYDDDGCQDASPEDNDDDNDRVSDLFDSCARGIMGWESNSITDYDGDGCQDASPEDEDDDNDNVLNNLDSCIKGESGWQSTNITDYDGDGCRDASPEDNDDDNDRVSDLFDSCARGIMGWESNSTTDYDDDGCQDASPEDTDDDNDGAPDDRDDYPLDRTRQGDGDGIVDAYDIDADGDGLIEIATADELNLVREDLTGSSLNGNKSGCGDGVNITSCTGYELVADIDLALMDWRPIAPCLTPTSSNICLRTETFRGHFEGNGHTISNVQVLTDVDDRGIGFFGATNGAQLRNINIKGLTIKFNDNIVASVGGLVGQAAGQTSIINNTVKGDISITEDVSAIDRIGVGGLVGHCVDVVIKNSVSLMGTVVASADSVGGLVGFCATSRIDGSYGHTLSIANNRVSGVKYLGGFIGRAEGATIKNSYSYAHRIRASYTASPLNGVGGFIGSADQDTSADQATRIVNTYAVSSVIVVPSLSASSNQFGGFAGEFKGSSFETSSYWDNSVTDFLAYRSKVASNSLASGKGTLELVRTAELSGSIYDNWGQFWCNPTTFDIVQQLTQPAGYIALWDLGSTSEYPVLNCTPLNVAEQRIFFADIQINDLDKDGLFNAEDIDDDGDGLIEISNATALDAVRESVRGNSLAGITAGCGNSIDIFDCNGYELTADIDLSAFSSWEPIAGCERKDVNDNCIMPSSFISKFDGNGHTISNLRLNTPTLLAKQLGLFASVAYTDIRNVHIENPQMYVSGSTYNEVGILAGYVLSSTISNISISGDTLTSIGDHRTLTSHVGGMIGYCEEAVIKTASVRLASMTVHANDVGGLAGRCQNSQISGAFTQIGSIKTFLKDQTNHAYVGGLVGALEGADSLVDASYSHTQVIEIPAPQNGGEAGGLIGQISDSGARVSHSYAVAKKIIVGRQGSAIEAGRSLSAAGGLVASTVTSVSDSFWDSSVLAYSVNPSTLLNQPSGVGVAKSSIELRLPVDFVGSLYDNWKDLWCNPLTSDIQTSVPAPGNDWVRLWDLGSNSDYPVMNCANAKKSAQRVALNNIKIGRSLFDLPVDSGTIIDTDADGVADLEDVDADGDGLIEIATATEFNDMREDSYGRSLSGNSNGCGNDFNAFVCKGYELVSDIDLASFSSWDPLAGCTARDVSGCSNFIAFGGDLQGNGHTISNLRIDSSTSHYHIGLFAATTGSNIENLQIESPHISISGNTYQAVGTLVGIATGGAIRGISINGGSFMVEGAHIDINSYVGGMIGSCADLDLERSSVRLGSMTAYANDVGGLAGRCKNTRIKATFTQIGAIRAFVNNLQGHAYVGGLIGVLEDSTAAVEGSYSHTYLIEAPAPALGAKVGGLIGYVEAGTPLISNSYAVGKKIVIGGGGNFVEAGRSTSVVGGLVAASAPTLFTYWDDGVSAYYISPSNPLLSSLDSNSARSSLQLQSPVNFGNRIYRTWADLWCNVGTSDVLSAQSSPGVFWSQIWNLGTATDYPTLNCLSTNNAKQRTALANILADRSPLAFNSADIIDYSGPDGIEMNEISDYDGDGFNGIADLDDDGDGLIEIDTLEDMLRVSNDLRGTSLAGSTVGCGDSLTITKCNGYELVADIDLSSETQWPVIGSCNLSNCDDAQAFSGIFEGNNHIINNLTMTGTTASPALGLFGSTVDATIRNVHIRNLNIDLALSRLQYAGALVGRSKSSSITHSSVTGNIISDGSYSGHPPKAVGGLVGSCVDTTILSSASQMGRITTNGEGIGGLVGGCESGYILNSYSQVGLIEPLPAHGRVSYVGGLIGDVGSDTVVRSVYSHINTMNVTNAVKMNLGGIIGILRGGENRWAGYAIIDKVNIIGNTALESNFGGIAGLLEGGANISTQSFYWNSRGIGSANVVGDGIVLSQNGGILRTTYKLQSTISFPGNIYSNWGFFYCNPQTSDLRLSTNPIPGYINSWNLGATNEYPAINCSPFTPAEQREVANVLFPAAFP